jgi:hypothetical protein
MSGREEDAVEIQTRCERVVPSTTGLDGVFKAIRDSFRLPDSRRRLERLTAVEVVGERF